MQQEIILLKYGELTTKKANRHLFINTLKQNIIKKLDNLDYKLVWDNSRMYIYPNNNIEEIIKRLLYIFGLHRIVRCLVVDNNKDDIKKSCLSLMKENQTFKVITHRSFKEFINSSYEFNCEIADNILDNISNTKVDVHHPEVSLNIEIREKHTYIYTDGIKALGGYPIKVAGRGLVMLSGGIDSPVAAFLGMKRGVLIECIHFASFPHTSEESLNKVKDLVKILTNYQDSIKLHIVNFTPIQEAIYKNINSDYMITIMRRFMYRIAQKTAENKKSKILINGECLGQVASQTLDSLKVINEVVTIPIIRPVVCLDKLEIIDIAKKINTYDTSILPFEDCCTVFVPTHPVINPISEKCISLEECLDINLLIDNAVKSINTVVISTKDKQKFDDLF